MAAHCVHCALVQEMEITIYSIGVQAADPLRVLYCSLGEGASYWEREGARRRTAHGGRYCTMYIYIHCGLGGLEDGKYCRQISQSVFPERGRDFWCVEGRACI